MNSDLDRVLCLQYPKIFADRHAPVRESAMGRGIEIGDGWYPLLNLLCSALDRETKRNAAPQVVAVQIKEKLGGLRFRTWHASERQRAMIEFAEDLSLRICDVCGAAALSKSYSGGIDAPRCRQHQLIY